MFYVYLLISRSSPDQRYVGYTTDLAKRVRSHNEGASVHTRKYKPWNLVSYFAFDDERRVREFEHYFEIRVRSSVRQQKAMAERRDEPLGSTPSLSRGARRPGNAGRVAALLPLPGPAP